MTEISSDITITVIIDQRGFQMFSIVINLLPKTEHPESGCACHHQSWVNVASAPARRGSANLADLLYEATSRREEAERGMRGMRDAVDRCGETPHGRHISECSKNSELYSGLALGMGKNIQYRPYHVGNTL